MNYSEFFIRKPVFCFVLASFLILVGFLSLKELPLRQFPDVERSEISIDTIYPGASSSIIETKITEIIEAQISGIDGIESVSSVSRDGRSKVTIEFVADKNIDEAANDVRDSVSRILENLPKILIHQKFQKLILIVMQLCGLTLLQMTLTNLN